MKKLNAIMNYDNKMDSEVKDICNALNSLTGIKTSESCSGHNKDNVKIWFSVTNFISLFFLVRCVDDRYWKFGNFWNITLTIGDKMYGDIQPTYFILSGNGVKGKRAYEQLDDLIDNMNYHLNHTVFLKEYNINIKDFKYTNE